MEANEVFCRLLDHSLAEELVRSRTDLIEFYYDWAFFNDENLFNQFVNVLRVLGTRDLGALCDIQMIAADLVRRNIFLIFNISGKL